MLVRPRCFQRNPLQGTTTTWFTTNFWQITSQTQTNAQYHEKFPQTSDHTPWWVPGRYVCVSMSCLSGSCYTILSFTKKNEFHWCDVIMSVCFIHHVTMFFPKTMLFKSEESQHYNTDAMRNNFYSWLYHLTGLKKNKYCVPVNYLLHPFSYVYC